MKRMIINMGVFSLALAIITLLMEYYKHQSINIENWQSFIITILTLGIVGGYIYTWAYDKK